MTITGRRVQHPNLYLSRSWNSSIKSLGFIWFLIPTDRNTWQDMDLMKSYVFERKPTDFLEEIYAQLQPRNDDLIDLIDRKTMAFWGWDVRKYPTCLPHFCTQWIKPLVQLQETCWPTYFLDLSWMMFIYFHGFQAGFPSQKNVAFSVRPNINGWNVPSKQKPPWKGDWLPQSKTAEEVQFMSPDDSYIMCIIFVNITLIQVSI